MITNNGTITFIVVTTSMQIKYMRNEFLIH